VSSPASARRLGSRRRAGIFTFSSARAKTGKDRFSHANQEERPAQIWKRIYLIVIAGHRPGVRLSERINIDHDS
jgi:hypothetical protein